MKKIAVLFIGLIIAIFIAGFFASSTNFTFTYNGQDVGQPLTFLSETFGILAAAMAVLCISILLIFFLTGVGLFVLGLLISCALVCIAFALPVLLPILLPVFLVGVFSVCMRTKRKNAENSL